MPIKKDKDYKKPRPCRLFGEDKPALNIMRNFLTEPLKYLLTPFRLTMHPSMLYTIALMPLLLYSNVLLAPPKKADNSSSKPYKLAKFEPTKGCYLGAFIDFDLTLNMPYVDILGHTRQDPAGFETVVGKSHAVYFFYLGYGRPLPLDWVQFLGSRGKFVHIALEPNSGLDNVKDDQYLRSLADDMQKSGAKIFLRFASEMNGNWTNYHGDPKKYIQKFRLVHKIMAKRAPNVAMVWCPYATPTRLIDSYYPGDDVVDWVGVNLYSVTHHNNDANAIAEHEDPVSLMEYVYKRYSARKPIMICEFGATHRSALYDEQRPGFAGRKIERLYTALKNKYPRVKCVNYYNGNNMDAVPGRAYNDYSITNHDKVLEKYKQVIASSHFLGEPLPEHLPDKTEIAVKPLPEPTPVASSIEAENSVPLPRVFVRICPDTGLRANSYCPEKVLEAYVKGKEPKRYCKRHKEGSRY